MGDIWQRLCGTWLHTKSPNRFQICLVYHQDVVPLNEMSHHGVSLFLLAIQSHRSATSTTTAPYTPNLRGGTPFPLYCTRADQQIEMSATRTRAEERIAILGCS
eukprot:10477885-Prorocentrum_lima.AAC.1